MWLRVYSILTVWLYYYFLSLCLCNFINSNSVCNFFWTFCLIGFSLFLSNFLYHFVDICFLPSIYEPGVVWCCGWLEVLIDLVWCQIQCPFGQATFLCLFCLCLFWVLNIKTTLLCAGMSGCVCEVWNSWCARLGSCPRRCFVCAFGAHLNLYQFHFNFSFVVLD